MKHFSIIGIFLTFGLVACSASGALGSQTQSSSSVSSSYFLSSDSSSSAPVSMKDLYRYYESKDLGVSFYYPAEYAFTGANLEDSLEFGGVKIDYKEMHFMTENDGGEPIAIGIMATSNPQILKYEAQYHPLETVRVNGVQMQKFTIDGVGSPIGFIRKMNGTYYAIDFDFPPSEEVMERVVDSIKAL